MKTSEFPETNGYGEGVPPKTAKLLEEVKAYCEKRHITRSALSRMVGVKRSAVTDWFAGRKSPTGEQVLTLLEILKK